MHFCFTGPKTRGRAPVAQRENAAARTQRARAGRHCRLGGSELMFIFFCALDRTSSILCHQLCSCTTVFTRFKVPIRPLLYISRYVCFCEVHLFTHSPRRVVLFRATQCNNVIGNFQDRSLTVELRLSATEGRFLLSVSQRVTNSFSRFPLNLLS